MLLIIGSSQNPCSCPMTTKSLEIFAEITRIFCEFAEIAESSKFAADKRPRVRWRMNWEISTWCGISSTFIVYTTWPLMYRIACTKVGICVVLERDRLARELFWDCDLSPQGLLVFLTMEWQIDNTAVIFHWGFSERWKIRRARYNFRKSEAAYGAESVGCSMFSYNSRSSSQTQTYAHIRHTIFCDFALTNGWALHEGRFVEANAKGKPLPASENDWRVPSEIQTYVRTTVRN